MGAVIRTAVVLGRNAAIPRNFTVAPFALTRHTNWPGRLVSCLNAQLCFGNSGAAPHESVLMIASAPVSPSI